MRVLKAICRLINKSSQVSTRKVRRAREMLDKIAIQNSLLRVLDIDWSRVLGWFHTLGVLIYKFEFISRGRFSWLQDV